MDRTELEATLALLGLKPRKQEAGDTEVVLFAYSSRNSLSDSRPLVYWYPPECARGEYCACDTQYRVFTTARSPDIASSIIDTDSLIEVVQLILETPHD